MRKNGNFWEKMETFEKFWEILIFLGIFPFTLVFALSFAIWTFWGKNGNFWEKNGNFWEKFLGQKTLVEPFVKNPTDLGALCARQSKEKNKKFLYQFWAWFPFAHTSVTGQQIIDAKIKCNVIVSPVMLQVAHRKCRKQAQQFHWTCHQSLQVCAHAVLCLIHVFGPQWSKSNCQLHKQLKGTMLAGHVHCNGAQKKSLAYAN